MKRDKFTKTVKIEYTLLEDEKKVKNLVDKLKENILLFLIKYEQVPRINQKPFTIMLCKYFGCYCVYDNVTKKLAQFESEMDARIFYRDIIDMIQEGPDHVYQRIDSIKENENENVNCRSKYLIGH